MKGVREVELVVLGVDGIAPRYLEDALERYELEGWQRLMEEAFFCELPSTVPAVTIPAWVTMFSGYNPGRFEAYHLTRPDFERWEAGVEDGNFQGINFWDKTGAEVSLHNVPGTSPVYPVNGFMRGGFPSPEDFEFYPEELEDEFSDLELEKQESHGKATTRAKFRAEFANFELEEKVAERMMAKDTDVFVSVIKMTDDASHVAEKEKHVLKAYHEVDSAVKRAVEKAEEEDANLLVVSDHGFMHSDRKFNIVKFLEEQDLIELEEGADDSLLYSIVEPFLDTPLKRLLKPLHNVYKDHTGKRLDGKTGDIFASIEKDSKVLPFHMGLGKDCELKVHTRDMPHGHVSPEEKEEILDELEEKLLELERDGEPVVKRVWRGEELYPEGEKRPDLVFRTRELPVETKPAPKLYTKTNTFTHDTNGVFFAKGPDIDTDAGEELDIFDVTPLIYALLREEVPEDLDGEVPENLIPGVEVEYRTTDADDLSV